MWDEIPAVVNLPTWLWVTDDWDPIEESESQGFVTVVVQARPVDTTWDPGDGAQVICDGPGVEWAPGMPDDATDCTYTYRGSGSTLTASVTVRWVFHWWLNGNDMGDFGELPVTADLHGRRRRDPGNRDGQLNRNHMSDFDHPTSSIGQRHPAWNTTRSISTPPPTAPQPQPPHRDHRRAAPRRGVHPGRHLVLRHLHRP